VETGASVDSEPIPVWQKSNKLLICNELYLIVIANDSQVHLLPQEQSKSQLFYEIDFK
jgi:hypothetical protein